MLTRQLILAALEKHRQLTVSQLATGEQLGLVPDPFQLQFLLHQLLVGGSIRLLPGMVPDTYSLHLTEPAIPK